MAKSTSSALSTTSHRTSGPVPSFPATRGLLPADEKQRLEPFFESAKASMLRGLKNSPRNVRHNGQPFRSEEELDPKLSRVASLQSRIATPGQALALTTLASSHQPRMRNSGHFLHNYVKVY
jgi:hypothetical protein